MEDNFLAPLPPPNEGDELEYDESAYIMLHQAQSGAPCLSFDFVKSTKSSTEFPLNISIVAGTQALKSSKNYLIVMNMNNLNQTYKENDNDSDSSSSSEDEDELEKKPNMNCSLVQHNGSVNRTRVTMFNGNLYAAAWSEFGRVSVYDVTEPLDHAENKPNR